MKPLAKTHIHILFPIQSWASKPSWTRDRIAVWVHNAGAVLQKDLDESTTHLVVDEKAWKNRVRAVERALEAGGRGEKVFVVMPEWLENCLQTQKKFPIKKFLWERAAGKAEGSGKKKKGEGEGEGGEEARGYKSMMGEVFQESTEQFVDERARRALEARIAGEERVRREVEEAEAVRREAEKKVQEQKRKEHAAAMRKTAKMGRGLEFTESHHVYKDSTGFEYDVVLAKVNIFCNTNERVILTIFESNDDQNKHYACNFHFAGTGKQPRNNVLEPPQTNLETAFRLFRKAFQEKTGVNWDDRIKAHNERIRAREREREEATMPDGRINESYKSRISMEEDAIPFEQRKFEYMPPMYSARGLLPEGRDEAPQSVRRTSQGRGRLFKTSVSTEQLAEEQNHQVNFPEEDQTVEPATETDDTAAPQPALGDLLAGLQDYASQNLNFDAGEIAQEQQNFDFDQDEARSELRAEDFTIPAFDASQWAAPGDSGSASAVAADAGILEPGTLGDGQTQLATRIGEDLLGFEAGGYGESNSTPSLEKHKRDEDDTDDSSGPAKRFESD